MYLHTFLGLCLIRSSAGPVPTDTPRSGLLAMQAATTKGSGSMRIVAFAQDHLGASYWYLQDQEFAVRVWRMLPTDPHGEYHMSNRAFSESSERLTKATKALRANFESPSVVSLAVFSIKLHSPD